MSFDFQKIIQEAGEWVISSGLRIFLILILTLIAIKACQVLIDQLHFCLLALPSPSSGRRLDQGLAEARCQGQRAVVFGRPNTIDQVKPRNSFGKGV